jgi:hypothetical protein
MTSLKKSHLIFLVVAVVLIAIFYFMDYSFLDNFTTPVGTPVSKTENFSTYYDSHQANPTMVPTYCIIIIIIIGIIASLR